MANNKFFDKLMENIKVKLSDLGVTLEDQPADSGTTETETKLEEGVIETLVTYSIVGEPVLAGETPIPDGEYLLKDGKTLKVVDGLLSEIVEEVKEEVVEEPAAEMTEEVVEEVKMSEQEVNTIKEGYEKLLDAQKAKYEQMLTLQKEIVTEPIVIKEEVKETVKFNKLRVQLALNEMLKTKK